MSRFANCSEFVFSQSLVDSINPIKEEEGSVDSFEEIQRIAEGCETFLKEFGFRVINSEEEGCGGSVTFGDGKVVVLFDIDRGRTSCEIGKVGQKLQQFEILRTLISGKVYDESRLDVENLAFLKDHFSDILDCLNRETEASLNAKCRDLMMARAKRMGNA